jgi:hypothetical protein
MSSALCFAARELPIAHDIGEKTQVHNQENDMQKARGGEQDEHHY